MDDMTTHPVNRKHHTAYKLSNTNSHLTDQVDGQRDREASLLSLPSQDGNQHAEEDKTHIQIVPKILVTTEPKAIQLHV